MYQVGIQTGKSYHLVLRTSEHHHYPIPQPSGSFPCGPRSPPDKLCECLRTAAADTPKPLSARAVGSLGARGGAGRTAFSYL